MVKNMYEQPPVTLNNRIQKRPWHLTLEIQVLAWDRHTNVLILRWIFLYFALWVIRVQRQFEQYFQLYRGVSVITKGIRVCGVNHRLVADKLYHIMLHRVHLTTIHNVSGEEHWSWNWGQENLDNNHWI